MKDKTWDEFLHQWFEVENRVSLSKAQYNSIKRISKILENDSE